MDPIAKLYKQKILTEATNDDINRVAKQHPDLDRSVIQDYADNADPKPGKGSRYLDWLVKGHVNGNHATEDAPRLKDSLNSFEKHKSKLDKKDINQYKHISEVEDAVQPHLGVVSKTAANKESTYWENPEHHEKIYDNGKGLKVYHTKTKEASQAIYGGGHTAGGCHTSWCTAGRSEHNRFDHYSKNGENPLYQIHTPDGKVYQDEFSGDYSGGLRTAADRSVDRTDLVKENPDLRKVPAFQGKALEYTGPGPKLDEALHKEIDRGNYDTVLKHTDAKVEHLNKIAETAYSGDSVVSALKHPKSDASTISTAIPRMLHGGDDQSEAILNHPHFGEEHATQIMNTEGWTNLKSNFFDSDKVKPHHIDAAMETDVGATHDIAAKSPITTDEQREKFFNKGKAVDMAMRTFKSPELITKHYSPSLVHAVSGNPNTPSGIIEKAYDDTKYDSTKYDLALHKNAPESVISKHIGGSKQASVVSDILKKQKNVTSDHVAQAFAKPHMLIKQAALRHPKATEEMHNEAIKNPSFHGSISVSPSASPEHLDQLSGSEHDFIRQNVAENKKTSRPTLERLAEDPVKDIADAATKALKKRK